MSRRKALQAAIITTAPSDIFAQSGPAYDHMLGWGAGMLWGPLAWIFWLGIVVVVVLLVQRFASGLGNRDKSANEALEILKNRYARGEITKEEYESMRRDLER